MITKTGNKAVFQYTDSNKNKRTMSISGKSYYLAETLQYILFFSKAARNYAGEGEIKKFRIPVIAYSKLTNNGHANITLQINKLCEHGFLTRTNSRIMKNGIFMCRVEGGRSRYASLYSMSDEQRKLCEKFLREYYTFFESCRDPFQFREHNSINRVLLQKHFESLYPPKQKKIKLSKQELAIHSQFDELAHSLNDTQPKNYQFEYISENKGRLINHFEAIKKNGGYREQEFASCFKCDESDVRSFDVNGSIYRLSYNLNHPENPLPHNVDIYQYFFNKLCDTYGITPVNLKEYCLRDSMKKTMMPLYMRGSSYSYIALQYAFFAKDPGTNKLHIACHELFETVLANDLSVDHNFSQLIEQQLLKYHLPFDPCQYKLKSAANAAAMTNAVKPIIAFLGMDLCYESIFEVLGVLYDYMKSEFGIWLKKKYIFYYESDLHLLVVQALKERNIDVLNVYDNFYIADQSFSESDFYDLYSECLNKYIEIINRTLMKTIQLRLTKLINKVKKSAQQFVQYKSRQLTYNSHEHCFMDIFGNRLSVQNVVLA